MPEQTNFKHPKMEEYKTKVKSPAANDKQRITNIFLPNQLTPKGGA
jgi:hypothetical protein